MIKKLALSAMLLAAFAATASAQKWGGLAATPPMGWNSWNNFGCNVDEKLIRDTADAIVSNGMKEAGYEYVVIDDCWHGERDAKGFIQPNPEHFPSGMKALGDYIHSKGLKFGIYSDVGARTCAGRPGSRGHEYQDAMTYASWGVDYLKYDWCNSEGINPVGAYTTMRDALRKTDRPIVLSICEWGENKPWEWAKDIGHLWRTTGDITNCWDCVEDHGTWYSNGIMKILDMQKGLRIHAGPGHWNDPDMMEVGNGMSESEDRAHFSMWAMLAAPLIAGNDVRNMSPATRSILTNREVIAVNQDTLGIQAMPAITYGNGLEVWVKPLRDGGWAFCFLNRGESDWKIDFDWKEHFIKDDFSHYEFDSKQKEYSVRDLWAKKDLGTTASPLSATVGAHDVLMLRLAVK
jgi:alpha-galactosidase